MHIVHDLFPDNLLVSPSEATERRAVALDRQTNPPPLPAALLTLEGMTSYRRIEEAFHCKLKGPVMVDKKTLVELQNFQTVCLFETREMFMNWFSCVCCTRLTK